MRYIPFYCLLAGLTFACQAPAPPPAPNQEVVVDNSAAAKALVEQYFRYFNAHDWKNMSELYSAAPEMKDPAYGTKMISMRQDEILAKYSELHKAIPDVHDSVIAMYACGDIVTVEFISSGTGPDHSKFELPICSILEIKNGKITKDFTYYDNFEEPKK